MGEDHSDRPSFDEISLGPRVRVPQTDRTPKPLTTDPGDLFAPNLYVSPCLPTSGFGCVSRPGEGEGKEGQKVEEGPSTRRRRSLTFPDPSVRVTARET